MRTLLKTYLVFLWLFFTAAIGGFFWLSGGAFGLPENLTAMDTNVLIRLGYGLAPVHVLSALFGMCMGPRKSLGFFVCFLLGLILGLIGVLLIGILPNKKAPLAPPAGRSGGRRAAAEA